MPTYFLQLVLEPAFLFVELSVQLLLVVVPLLDLGVVELVVAGLQLEHVELKLGHAAFVHRDRFYKTLKVFGQFFFATK
jgi:hypothetical protein